MSGDLARWWRSRTPREQRLLLVMAALMTLTLAWLLVIRPLDDALSRARARHERAVIALGQARGQAEAIGALEHGGVRPLAAPVPALVGQAATEAGFDARVAPEGADSASVAIEAARAPAFFGWIARLEGMGLVVDRLGARANSDATLSVRATIRGRR